MRRLIAVTILIVLFGLLPGAGHAAPERQDGYEGAIFSPGAGATVSGQVNVTGTANHPTFWKYEVRVTPGQNPAVRDDQWYRVVVREQPVINGQLAIWDTTALPDGVYTLRLRVVRQDGNWMDYDILPLTVANTVPPTATPPPPTPVPATATTAPTFTPEPSSPTPEPTSEPSPIPEESPTPPGPSPTPLVIATLTPLGGGNEGGAAETEETGEESGEGETVAEAPTLTPVPTDAGSEPEPTVTPSPVIIEQPTIIVPTSESAAGQEASDGANDEDESEIALAPQETLPPTPVASDDPLIPALPVSVGGVLDTSTLLGSCIMGAAFTAGIFFLIGLLYLLKSLVGLFR